MSLRRKAIQWTDEKDRSYARVGIVQLLCVKRTEGWQAHIGAYITVQEIAKYHPTLDECKEATIKLAMNHLISVLNVLKKA